MSKAPSRSSSSIIQMFTLVKQEMELEGDKSRFEEIIDNQSTRRKKREQVHSKKKKQKQSNEDAIKSAEAYRNMTEHKIPLEELYQDLQSNPEKGLTEQVANEQHKKYGDNLLTEKKRTPWFVKLAHEMFGFFALLLWAGSIMCFIAYALAPEDPSNLYLGIVLAIVVFLTGLVTFYQNQKSDAIMDSFKNFIPPKATCIRDGEKREIEARLLVPGDIVLIKDQCKIPADVRIIECTEMKVDHSSLTGESDLLQRSVTCTHPDKPLETSNLAFFGTMNKEGTGKGIVINTGDKTVIGQIANLASTAGSSKTPLRREIDRFIFVISIIAIITGIFFFCMGFLLGYSVITNLVFGIGIVVANVPEGLLATVTASLSLTAKRLSYKYVLVKNLEAVETLGSTTCICSDKTGTLTQNKMTVEKLWFDGSIVKGENLQVAGSSNVQYDPQSKGFKALQQAAISSSEAYFNRSVPTDLLEPLQSINSQTDKEAKRLAIEKEYHDKLDKMNWIERPVVGDASETAIVKFFQPIEDITATRARYPVRIQKDKSEARIRFNSSWKYALSICEREDEDSVSTIYIKGAPEKVWSFCSYVLANGEKKAKDADWEKEFEKANRVFGDGGERVLGFAQFKLNSKQYPADYYFQCQNASDKNYPLEDFTFLGLISMRDPPRLNVPNAVKKCMTAGIKVIMVTGDQPVTATAIARQVNIFGEKELTVNEIAEEKKISIDEAYDYGKALVIHGDMITEATKRDELLPENERGRTLLRWLEKPRIVFARTTPAQKLIIVKGCQEQGHVVAVTGDGVNDSPAIKKADIGIAMGITGSEVAKDAADMILLNDDFASIVLGIEEGRRIFDNLKKSICYTLTSNIPEITPFLLLIILRLPLPLSTVLILCIDLGTDIIPAIAMASEESEVDIMVRAPRKRYDHLVTAKLLTASYGIVGIFQSFGGFLSYFSIMLDFGFPYQGLIGLAVDLGIAPDERDVYDPNLPYYGHSSAQFKEYCDDCWSGDGPCDPNDLDDDGDVGVPDWLYNKDSTLDLRLFYLQCTADGGYKEKIEWRECNVKQVSEISKLPICYTTESLKYAHTGFFFSIVLVQLSNAFVVKTRKQSFSFGGLRNFSLIFGFTSETVLTLFLAYLRAINEGLGTRDVYFLHYGVPALPFSMFELLYEETRKFVVRNAKPAKDKPSWWYRNLYW